MMVGFAGYTSVPSQGMVSLMSSRKSRRVGADRRPPFFFASALLSAVAHALLGGITHSAHCRRQRNEDGDAERQSGNEQKRTKWWPAAGAKKKQTNFCRTPTVHTHTLTRATANLRHRAPSFGSSGST